MGADPAIHTVRIFLASSAELADHRREFEIFINRQNKQLVGRNVFLDLTLWEDFLDAMSPAGLQSEYNRALQQCDLFVMLFRTKVGRYTAEEFEKAFGQFKATGRPRIWTYFNDAQVTTGQVKRVDMNSLWDFQEKLRSLGHFQTPYANHDALCRHFGEQLAKLEIEGFFGAVAEHRVTPSFGHVGSLWSAAQVPPVVPPADAIPAGSSTDTTFAGDRADVLGQCRQTLLKQSSGFSGPFGDTLWKELRRHFGLLLQQKTLSAQSIADCFADAPEEKVEVLFSVLAHTRRACKKFDEVEINALCVLVAFAAVRSIDTQYWANSEIWSGGKGNSYAKVHELATTSSLVAAIGFAGVNGLVMRSGASGAPDGVCDLSRLAQHTQPAKVVLATLYDEIFKDIHRRPLPTDELTPQELGRLRDHFDELRVNGDVVAVYVRLSDSLSSDQRLDVLSKIAGAINNRVVLGSERNATGLTLEQTGITCESLEVKVTKILGGLAPKRADDTPLAPPTVQPGQPPKAPESPFQPRYRYDLFISHASEDKADFVDGLANLLKGYKKQVWYDVDQIKGGDDIVAAINLGLSQCRCGMVVLSPHFMRKQWPQDELSSLFSLAQQPGRKLIPLLRGTTQAEVVAAYPLLGIRACIDGDRDMHAVMTDILEALKPTELAR